MERLDPSEVPLWISESNIDEYFELATIIVLSYDAIITMDREAKYFWRRPKSVVDFVYFMNRYIGILGAISRPFDEPLGADLSMCNFSAWMRNIANWINIVSIDYILMIRVLALYSQDRRMGIFLRTLFALSSALKMGLVIYLTITEQVALMEFPNGVTTCSATINSTWELGILDWLIPIIFGTILIVLSIIKGVEYWRVSARFKGFALVKVLLRDQVIYFILVIACCTFAVLYVMLRIPNYFVANILARLGSPSFLSLLGTRMLFNLKEAGERGQNLGTSYMPTMSAMVFGGHEPENASTPHSDAPARRTDEM